MARRADDAIDSISSRADAATSAGFVERVTARPGRLVLGVVAIVIVALLPFSITIVDEGELESTLQSEEFDPATYVDDIWDDELLPAVDRGARPLAEILAAMQVDGTTGTKEQLQTVVAEFGSITQGEAHVYLIEGDGVIEEVSPLGLATVALDGYDGPIAVELYAGERIPSDETSVRDAVGFIEFGDFREQTEYGKVGAEINRRILEEVVGPATQADLTGQRVRFTGAFGIRTFNLVAIDLGTVRIVPVSLEVVDS